MSGYNALWLPGTDHAGIATQMVVERELKKTENKTRHDLGRDGVRRARLGVEGAATATASASSTSTSAHRSTGSRARFTMDEACSRAVREVFVRLYEEGLIYRAQRLINWCPIVPDRALAISRSSTRSGQGELWRDSPTR